MLTPLETELLAALEQLIESCHLSSGRIATDEEDALIAKAEKAGAKTARITPGHQLADYNHRLAHNDGFHKETPEPNCPACQRIVRLEVYAAEDDVDDALHRRPL